MGLIDEAYCGICGEKTDFPDSLQLKDGSLCKSCAAKLSPRFSGRYTSTVEEIRDHLVYRAENAKAMESLHADLVFGDAEKIYLDRIGKKMIVTSSPDSRLHRSAVQKTAADRHEARDITARRITRKKELLPAGSWQCPACGTVNAGKFCTECGTPRPTENI